MNRIASLVLLIVSLVTAPALAQTTTAAGDDPADDTTGTTGGDTGTTGSSTGGSTTTTTSTSTVSGGGSATQLGDEQVLLEERQAPPAQRSGFEPGELHDETYIFAGVLARGLIVPTFIQNLFVNEGSTPVDGGFGAYFNYRRNGFNVQVEIFYQSMYNDGYYRGASDPDTETEYVRSRLGVVLGNISFGWAFDITDWFAFELGFGIGFGGVVGDLYRQEAYRDTAGQLQTCTGQGMPASGDYCENSLEMPAPGGNGRLDDTRVRGGTYQISNGTGAGTGPSPFYFGDGGVPPIFFNIDLPRIAFRFKPMHQIQIRIEGAYNLYGFSFGGSLGYGF